MKKRVEHPKTRGKNQNYRATKYFKQMDFFKKKLVDQKSMNAI